MLDIDIQLDRHEFKLDMRFRASSPITGVFGPSGAGKSTLLSCIAGLTTPDCGHIVIKNNVLYDNKSQIHLPPHKRNIGIVFQDNRLFPNYSVEGNLKYGMARSKSKDKNKWLQIIDALEIGHLLNRSIHDLSGGEKQRIALGRAILSNPSLLLLDEPFSALDRKLTRKVVDYIKILHNLTAIPMIIVSHDITTILALTNRIVVVSDGACVANGCFKDLCSKFSFLQLASQQGYAFNYKHYAC